MNFNPQYYYISNPKLKNKCATGYLVAHLLPAGGLITQIISQFSPSCRMAQPAESLGFDLADSFPGDTHFSANFLKSVSLPIQ
jgi:hypothetical protein